MVVSKISAKLYILKCMAGRAEQKKLGFCLIFFYFLFISRKFTIYSTNGAISKYVVRKHLCVAIIQWWFSYIYSVHYVVRASILIPLSGPLSQTVSVIQKFQKAIQIHITPYILAEYSIQPWKLVLFCQSWEAVLSTGLTPAWNSLRHW
jgi:hypothetical protein